MPRTKWFNAHHAPIGAFATFTLGSPGATGGLGLELGKPADENIYIGLETQEPNTFEAFPFYQAALDESARYSMEHATTLAAECPAQVRPFAEDSIDRRFALATDCWSAGDLSVTIYSPVHSIPDPDTADAEEVKAVVLPAVCVEMTVDNSQGTTPRRAFLG
ncbi:MAG TPA: glycoside hydrolase family 52 protein, partial [Armatimonadota bacterium]